MKSIAFFNNKGGVGKTTLVYHLAWKLAELGLPVVAADLDPQSNLTSAFLSDDRIEELWDRGQAPKTVLGAVQPLLERLGDLEEPHVEEVSDNLSLLVGDLALNLFEDRLAEAWPRCLDDNDASRQDAFRVTTAFRRVMRKAARARGAQVVLVDVGPNLGALNRAALVAADYVVVPLGADLFSLRGLQNLGPTLRQWRTGWRTRRQQPAPFKLPKGRMEPVGYVVMQHQERSSHPVKAYARWMERIRPTYAEFVLRRPADDPAAQAAELALLKHFRSLMPLAQDARKPMFQLTAADGAMGSHAVAARACGLEFEALARTIAARCGIALP